MNDKLGYRGQVGVSQNIKKEKRRKLDTGKCNINDFGNEIYLKSLND